MKFYVAGKWEDRDNVQAIQSYLIRAGHEITKDWTIDKETDNGYPVINTVEDIRGVAAADGYVGVFMNKYEYKGALVELGAALIQRKKVYIIGYAMNSCIFIHHPLVKQFDSMGDFLKEVSDATARADEG